VKDLYEAKVFTRLTPYSFSDLQALKVQTTVAALEQETGFDFETLRSVDSLSALESSRRTRFVQGPGDIII
jgi:endonuclease G